MTVDYAAGPQPLRILCRNLYMGANVLRLFTSGSEPSLGAIVADFYAKVEETRWSERVVRVADEIVTRRPQLVCLQEVFRYERSGAVDLDLLSSLLAQLKERGAAYSVANVAPASDVTLPIDVDATLRIVDRDVILAAEGVHVLEQGQRAYARVLTPDLPNGEHPEARKVRFARAFGWVRVAWSGRVVHAVNTHLEGSSHRDIQRAQAQELVDALATVEDQVVVAGDLNAEPCTAEDSTWRVFVDAGLSDAFPATAAPTCCEDEGLANAPSKHNLRIDHVLLRGPLRVQANEIFGHRLDERTPSGLWPSDHAGLLVTLE